MFSRQTTEEVISQLKSVSQRSWQRSLAPHYHRPNQKRKTLRMFQPMDPISKIPTEQEQ